MQRKYSVTAAVLACLLVMPALASQPCRLASAGKASVSIVVGAGANASVRHSAEELRDMLKQITGATFAIETGDGRKGLAVGMLGDFPALSADKQLAAAVQAGGRDLAAQQSYLLRSHRKGLQLVGASELAVEYAIWDLLYRAGYRQFFPGEIWEEALNGHEGLNESS